MEANVSAISPTECLIKCKKGKEILEYAIGKDGLIIKFNGYHIEKTDIVCKESIEVSYLNGKYYMEEHSEKPLWIRLSAEGIKSVPYYICEGDILRVGSANIFVSYSRDKKLIVSSDYNSCKICFQRENDAVLFPCKHNIVCTECAKVIKECPICRKEIEQWIQIYR